MFNTAVLYKNGPIVIRYPRGAVEGIPFPSEITPVKIGRGEVLLEGDEPLILTIGPIVYKILKIVREYENINPTVVDCKFVKPLDEKLIINLSKMRKKIITIEDNVIAGGFGSAVLELLINNGIKRDILRMGVPDRFIAHGKKEELFESIGIGLDDLKSRIKEFTK
jgi:1-deoxy-D-xylulose-5-phosphate synthase